METPSCEKMVSFIIAQVILQERDHHPAIPSLPQPSSCHHIKMDLNDMKAMAADGEHTMHEENEK